MALICIGFGLVFLYFGIVRRMSDTAKFKRAALFLKIIGIVALITGISTFGVFEYFIVRDARTDARDADYLIVMGAGIKGTEPTVSMEDRLNAALSYLREHPDCCAVLSGAQGPGEDISEAVAMRHWLMDRGIDDSRLILETRARDTDQNIIYSLQLISQRDSLHSVEIAVCTSEYHIHRSKLIAKDAGVIITAVAARTSLPILKINYFAREAAAVMIMKF